MRLPPTAVRVGLLAPAAFAVAALLLPGGPEGLFQAGLAALVVATLTFAFVPLSARAWLAATALAALGVGAGFALRGAGGAEALAAAALVAAHACAACGMAAVGRAAGAGTVGAGAVSALVLGVALQGLLWADPAAERLPLERRWAFRQSVLNLDGATALAYDAAGFDRMHQPRVYADVPLASSSYDRPKASSTALVWAALGLVAAGAAALVQELGRRGGRFRSGRSGGNGRVPS